MSSDTTCPTTASTPPVGPAAAAGPTRSFMRLLPLLCLLATVQYLLGESHVLLRPARAAVPQHDGFAEGGRVIDCLRLVNDGVEDEVSERLAHPRQNLRR